ncbi:MFS general substrate transporter [Ascobolus immersus RN42]|uniref:MFS general substrate transporter n=1 Tax=Ascobolus immersus RN42 TaxID=1160509 RepID=A0A3N4IZ80_ASCIM|nr:MFS general substrate transporter [Ascobolus immersus RN42]
MATYPDEKAVYDSNGSSTDFSTDNSRPPTGVATTGPDENGITWKYLEFDTPFEELGLPGTEADLPNAFKRLGNPFDWAQTKKLAICVLGSFSCLMAAYSASAYSSGLAQMMAEWNQKKIPLLCGITTFTTGFGIGPMFLAPISEVYGRKPLIMGAYLLFNITHLCKALCHSFPGMLVARFWEGVAGSTFSTIVGGIMADIFISEQRGLPMSIFALCAMVGVGLGSLINGWVVFYSTWRWIHWSQLIYCSFQMVVVYFVISESRQNVILSRKAKLLNKLLAESNSDIKVQWKARADDETKTWGELMSGSVILPFKFLVKEPVVTAFSAWISFSWAMLYMFLQSVPLVFTQLFDFNAKQVGYVFGAVIGGSIIGFICNFTYEVWLSKLLPDRGPENRLYLSCVLSPLVPAGMFWLGWTAYSDSHYILPALAVGCACCGIFATYLAVFNYLADAYRGYASSALAAQSFCRNMLSGILPLVAGPMYAKMGFQGGSGMLGGISLALCTIPWVLMIWGPQIRARSKFASALG